MKETKNLKSYKLIITNNLESKIRKLCNTIKTIEWSGILFYTKDIINKTYIAKDLFLMDIGDSVYTSFEETPELAGYIAKNDLFECEYGLIHSHHNMAAFFSGTDSSTLKSEGLRMNNFLSLIVNNAGKYVAKITKQDIIENNISTKIKHINLDGTIEESFNNKVETSKDVENEDLEIIKENCTIEDVYIDGLDEKLEKRNKSIYAVQDNLFDIEEGFKDINFNKTANKIVRQLITGSILPSYNEYASLNRLALTFKGVYERRFKSDKDFYHFYEDFICILLDEQLSTFIKNEYYYQLSKLSKEIIKVLKKVINNKYINMMIEIIETQINHGIY